MTTPPLHPRIAELLGYLDAQRAHLEREVLLVPEPLHGLRPAPDAWSVAHVLEHLALVEGSVAHLVGRRLAAARAAGLGPETSEASILDCLGADAPVASPTQPRTAPEMVTPRGGASVSASLSALARSRAELRTQLERASGLALGEVRAPHPALGDLDLYQWALFVGQHELRHARQLHAIGARLREGRA